MKTIAQIFAPLAFGAILLSGCGGNTASTETGGRETASTEGGSTTQTATAATGNATGSDATAGGTGSTSASGGTDVTRVSTGKPQGSVKVGGKTVCAVCAVKEGQTEAETVAATINYQGKTYAFCSADEKAEFINQPSRYADAR